SGSRQWSYRLERDGIASVLGRGPPPQAELAIVDLDDERLRADVLPGDAGDLRLDTSDPAIAVSPQPADPHIAGVTAVERGSHVATDQGLGVWLWVGLSRRRRRLEQGVVAVAITAGKPGVVVQPAAGCHRRRRGGERQDQSERDGHMEPKPDRWCGYPVALRPLLHR